MPRFFYIAVLRAHWGGPNEFSRDYDGLYFGLDGHLFHVGERDKIW